MKKTDHAPQTAIVLIALAGAGLAAQGGRSAPLSALPDVLSRAASYLDGYEARFSAVISQEEYQQRSTRYVGSPPRSSLLTRNSRAQLLILNAGSGVWLCFRDVFEVDGKTVPDHLERLATLLAMPAADSAGAASQANHIAEETARYNLGSVTRNFNVPTMALTFLKREQQARSSFRLSGIEKKGDGERIQVVAFTEKAQPTVVRGAKNRDVPATGRFWIEASGRIDRTELTLVDDDERVKATITVVYGPQPRVELWVPISMTEHYEFATEQQVFPGSPEVDTVEKTDAFATYSDFTVPTVSIDVAGFKAAVGRGRGAGGGA
jgi:hypothetical protein